MIMGIKSGFSMLLGTIIGWIILAPISKDKGWAPGKYYFFLTKKNNIKRSY